MPSEGRKSPNAEGRQTGSLMSFLGRFGEGGEDPEWDPHGQTPSKRPYVCLCTALLEAATRGQAPTSHEDHRKHQASVTPETGGSEAQEGSERGPASREELGLRTWTWAQILAPPVR